ncbi:MAG: hypothetical protein R3208_10560 [Ketobacteraceae bacterium]|nr:hypothetical protein [Ketobacteraceae bacterium]
MKPGFAISFELFLRVGLRALAVVIGTCCSLAFADPEKFTGKLKDVIKGHQAEVADRINGFYMDKSKGYYSYFYIVLSGDTLKAVYEYLEDGKKHAGFFTGQYHADKGYAVGDICYEDSAEWHGKGGMAFYDKKGTVKMNVFYTETKKASDNKWTNDWPHTKVATHPRLEALKTRMETASVACPQATS